MSRTNTILDILNDSEAEMTWRPIASAPRDGTEIIIGGPFIGRGGGFWRPENTKFGMAAGWCWESDRFDRRAPPIVGVTGWMPMPLPPPPLEPKG